VISVNKRAAEIAWCLANSTTHTDGLGVLMRDRGSSQHASKNSRERARSVKSTPPPRGTRPGLAKTALSQYQAEVARLATAPCAFPPVSRPAPPLVGWPCGLCCRSGKCQEGAACADD
jgi:hypothetical protein